MLCWIVETKITSIMLNNIYGLILPISVVLSSMIWTGSWVDTLKMDVICGKKSNPTTFSGTEWPTDNQWLKVPNSLREWEIITFITPTLKRLRKLKTPFLLTGQALSCMNLRTDKKIHRLFMLLLHSTLENTQFQDPKLPELLRPLIICSAVNIKLIKMITLPASRVYCTEDTKVKSFSISFSQYFLKERGWIACKTHLRWFSLNFLVFTLSSQINYIRLLFEIYLLA